MQLALLCFISYLLAISYAYKLPDDFLHFPDLEALKGYFRNDPNPLAIRILETFEKNCLYMDETEVPAVNRKPFIVIEGSNRAIRELIGMKMARKLGGRYLTNMAPCLSQYFPLLPQRSVIRRIYYLLSVYASVYNAKICVKMGRAVVLNGYWWEQVTYSLLQALKGEAPPPLTSPVFQQPRDLMRPDLIVFVDHPDKRNLLQQRSLEMYKNLSSMYPIKLQSMDHVFNLAAEDIYNELRANLSSVLDFSVSYTTRSPNYDLGPGLIEDENDYR